MHNTRPDRTRPHLIGTLFACSIYLFLFLPIFVVILNSFNANKTKPYATFKGFTFEWYIKLFDNPALLSSFGNTLLVAFASTVLSVLIGTLAAVGMHRYKFKGKSAIDALLYIPVVIPEIILGISLLSVFAWVSIPRGLITLILSHVAFSTPFVIFTLRARLSGYDLTFEEAAMDLGANRIKTFAYVTLPLILPGILSGGLLAFTLSIDDVIISYFVNGTVKTFPLKVMESIKSGVAPDVNALSTLILLGTTGIVLLTQSGLFKSEAKS
ncbi:MAG: Binding-protein-dependent transport system inner rane component [Clostridia bacterium]|jgi:spermidine/putrescine transport system permease protein|nr:Binding-protein-dependent transport system inner rane component [Clostridia bacterium]